jgi:hypothetical protein
MPRYTIVSIDNAHVGLGGVPANRGEFSSADAALEHAKELVDQALLDLGAAVSANDLMAQYMRRGNEVPMIYGEPRVDFHAFRYAREKANSMFAAPSNG